MTERMTTHCISLQMMTTTARTTSAADLTLQERELERLREAETINAAANNGANDEDGDNNNNNNDDGDEMNRDDDGVV
jgi:hypothetical protein